MTSRSLLAAVGVLIAGACIPACGTSDSGGGAGGAAGTAGAGGGSGNAATGGSAGDDASAGNGGTSGDAGAAGSSGQAGTAGSAGNSECAGTQPATMVKLPQGYSIDSTEVTQCQYRAWLDTLPSTKGQPDYCLWNKSYEPLASCMSGARVCKSNCAKQPQVCIDWCDAYAYCKAVGKRLCGKIGGGSNGYDDDGDASLSQWYNACSSGGINNFPYGGSGATDAADGFDPQKCNGPDMGAGKTLEVGACSGCQSSESSYAGVYDLSGNVWEMEDSCNGSLNYADKCRMRGGSTDESCAPGYLRCGSRTAWPEGGLPRSAVSYDVGFRCCSDP